MGILRKAISEDKKIELAFGLMDTIDKNILEIAKEVCTSEDPEYIRRALRQFVSFDEKTCRAIEYLKHFLFNMKEVSEDAGHD